MNTSAQSRRKYDRYPLYLDAHVRPSSGAASSGKIRDFSGGGLYVTWDSAASARISPNEIVEVRFRVGAGGARELQVTGSVARVADGGIGIAASKMPDDVLDALHQEHARQTERKNALANEASRSGEPRVLKALEEIKRAIEKPLAAAIAAFSEAADQELFQQASEAHGGEQRELLDARGMLKTRRSRLQADIVAAVLEDMMAEPDKTPAAASPALSMIEGSDLEYMLARAELSTQVEEYHKQALVELQDRYSALLGSHLDIGHLPAGPQAIAAAFNETMRGLGLSGKQLRLINRIFQGTLFASLGEIYSGLNKVLARAVPDGSTPAAQGTSAGMDLDTRSQDAVPTVERPEANAGSPPPPALQPLLQEAAAEPDFFRQKDHPLRRALAQVEELRTLIDPQDHAAQAELDRVVKSLGSGGAPNSATPAAQSELGAMVAQARAQSRQRQDALVEQFVQQRNNDVPVRGDGGGSGSGGAPALVPMAAHQAQAIWRRAAQRLKVGDTLLVSRDDGPPEQQRLAWVGEGADAFVLVSADGRRATTLNGDDLVNQLLGGQVAVDRRAQANTPEPAVYALARAMLGEARQKALLDPVTGLGNRKKFVSDWHAPPRPGELRQTLLYLRVVEIESLVARRGHAARDAFLKKLVALVQRRLDDRATITRVGDLEFAILHAGDALEANDAATRLQRDVRHIRIKSGGDIFSVGARIGVLDIPQGATPEAVLESADAATRTPEHDGAPAPPAPKPAPLDWSGWIERCLKPGPPELYVRWIRPLQGSGLAYAEISAGMAHDGHIQFADEDVEAGLQPENLFDLDLAVIGATLGWLGRHADALEHLEACIIRLRPASLADDRLLERVLELLMESAIPPAKLFFEVSETALNDNFEMAQSLVRTLREYGCGFVLSGLDRDESQHDCLKQLTLDALRFGGHFMRDIANSEGDQAVLRSANEIGHLLGLKTIAADVDSAAALERVTSIGFDYAQGAAIAPAQPLAEATWP